MMYGKERELCVSGAKLTQEEAAQIERRLDGQSSFEDAVRLCAYFGTIGLSQPSRIGTQERKRCAELYEWVVRHHPCSDSALWLARLVFASPPWSLENLRAICGLWIDTGHELPPGSRTHAARFLLGYGPETTAIRDLAEAWLEEPQASDPHGELGWRRALVKLERSILGDAGEEYRDKRAGVERAYTTLVRATEGVAGVEKQIGLISLARCAFILDDHAACRDHAGELLFSAPNETPVRSEVLFDAHVLLGRCELANGDREKALTHLEQSAGCDLTNHVGALDLTLAQELAEVGERDVVADFFDSLASRGPKWTKRYETWAVLLRNGRIPRWLQRDVELPR